MGMSDPQKSYQRVDELKAWNPNPSGYHPDDPICVYIIRPNFTSIFKIFALLFDWNVLELINLDIGFVFDVFWYGVIQRGRSPFVRIALPSSLMLRLEVVPSDGIGILHPICAWPPRGCTI
jgi:hypothetical protein